MVTYVDGWAARTARSRKDRTCQLCGGRIYKGMEYISRDDRRGGKRWQHHEHVDCQAPWWQVDLTHLLRHVGRLPHAVPPTDEKVTVLDGFDIVFHNTMPNVGTVTWHPSNEFQTRFLQMPNLAEREAAKVEIETALALFVDTICHAASHQGASRQLSNVLARLQQVKETATAAPKP